jgi:Tol biopolymer transport system component
LFACIRFGRISLGLRPELEMVDVASGLDFLSAEVVEGELLADKLAAGPLAPEEALQYALEIGKALATAHSRGLVHGCLSCDQVCIAADGAHVLDPRKGAGPSAARYRSPEQVRGEPADWRSDIFSFGVLLYEMAGGKRAFPGDGADRDDAILHQPPAALMAKSPVHAAMEGVIAGCLEKDPARRRQRIQNAVIELKLAGRSLPFVAAAAARRQRPLPRVQPQPQDAPFAAPPPPSAFIGSGQTPAAPGNGFWAPSAREIPIGRLRRLTIIGLATLALAATGVAAVLYLHQRPAAPVVKFSVAAPEHTSYPGTPSVSPDGLLLTFSAVGPEGQRMLWLRALDEMHARVIPGTEGAFAPFWSPDSEYIAFFANKELKKVRIRNASPDTRPESIAAAGSEPGGGAWNKDGTILFAPSMNDGFYRVNADGGKISTVLKLDAAKFEHGFLWPQFLPDGKHFVFFNQTGLPETTGVYAGKIEPAESHMLLSAETNAVYSPIAGAQSSRTGYLLYMKDRDLMGQGFNAGRLAVEGDPITLANDIGSVRTLALAPISVSNNAVLVYQSVGSAIRQLVWMDRQGKQTGMVGDGGMWGPPRLSPDGSRLVVGKLGKDNVNADLWLFDASGNASAFAQTPGVSEAFPVWSPDGNRIAFWSNPEGINDIYVKPVNGLKPELIYKNANAKYPTDWSRDGKFILYHEMSAGTKLDVWALSLPDRHAAGIVNTVYAEGYPAISPDGRWIAYQSDESGRFEVYVQPFEGLTSGTKRRWKISADTGNGQSGLPRWRGDSQELFYITSDGNMMSVSVSGKDGEFVNDVPKVLFPTRAIPKSWNLFDVSSDGQRFILNLPLEWSNSSVITVMTNWTEKLKR